MMREAFRWLGSYEARPAARVRLFCLPYAGGSASTYRGWSAELPPHVDVCPIQLPGREARFSEPTFRTIKALVPVLIDALEPLLDRPVALYGHSMGALVAFELAHELRVRGLSEPVALFPAAHLPPRAPHLGEISGQPEEALIMHVRKLGNSALLENPELLRLILRTLRADLSLCDSYSRDERPRLSCPITAFGGLSDMSPAELEGWREETAASFQLEMLPGGHFFLLEERARLLATIARALA